MDELGVNCVREKGEDVFVNWPRRLTVYRAKYKKIKLYKIHPQIFFIIFCVWLNVIFTVNSIGKGNATLKSVK